MTLGIAQYLTLQAPSTVIARWQNYYVNQTITLNGLSYGFQFFEADAIEAGDLQSESTLSVTFPAVGSLYALLLTAVRNAYFITIETYSFDPRQGNTLPQLGQILIGTYSGTIVNAERSIDAFTIGLGAPLAPVGAQVSPRKFTSRLIGVPCRLD